MKKAAVLLMTLVLVFSFISCGKSAPKVKTVKTTSDIQYCVLETLYTFDENDALYSVSQVATYSSKSHQSSDYSLIESAPDFFSELEQTDNVISCSLTPDGIENFYPDANYESVLADADAQELTVETGTALLEEK